MGMAVAIRTRAVSAGMADKVDKRVGMACGRG